jgi:hypothetical protein
VVLKETAGRWIVPPLLRVAGDTARLCRLADHDARRRGQQDAFRLELNGDQGGDGAEDGSAGGGGGGGGGVSGAQGSGAVGFSSVLRESFSTCATQKAALLRDAYGQPDYRLNRKIGAVALANLIFRLLFRSQEPRYCKEIQKDIPSKANMVSCVLRKEHRPAPSVTVSRGAHQLTRGQGSARDAAPNPNTPDLG